MKNQFYVILLFLFLGKPIIAQEAPKEAPATDDTEVKLPGDDFSLDAALELFKKSDSPEDFEKRINDENNKVNNLDLNGDGDIDYIRVIDQTQEDVHAIILQAVISETESQDVAVIEIEKTGNDAATLQIIGDEELYGEQTIVEPFEEDAKGGKGGPSVAEDVSYVVVNVWGWPSVRFIYAPLYRPWISPWRWRVYPTWWRPWRPLGWAIWRPHVRVFRPGFHVVNTHRVVRAHRVYSPVRVTSVSVRTRHAGAINHHRTVKKTTIHTGGGKTIKHTKTTTVHKGPKGNKVKTTKTKTRVTKRK